MGAVISSIANVFMLLVNGVAAVLQAIIGGIAAILFGIVNMLTCGRAAGPTATRGAGFRPAGMDGLSTATTGRRRLRFGRRRPVGAVAQDGGVGAVPLNDAVCPGTGAGGVAPGMVGNWQMTMGPQFGVYPAGAGLRGAGVTPGMGAGAMYGPNGPGPTPYGAAAHGRGVPNGGVPAYVGGGPASWCNTGRARIVV